MMPARPTATWADRVNHDLPPSFYEPFDLEQLYFAFRFLFAVDFWRFGAQLISPLACLASYVDSMCPESQPRSRLDYLRLLRRLAFIGGKDVAFSLKYSFWVQLFPDTWWTCMNYGYCDLETPNALSELEGVEADWRLALELYRQTLLPRDLAGEDVLEVGSGRGGGAAYIARHHRPRRVIAMDGTASNTAFCRSAHQLDNLSFVHGRAEDLPFADGSFDAVVNVESCNYYRPLAAFLREVQRVLRAGGHLLLTTYEKPGFFMALQRECRAAGLTLERQRDVTANVHLALDAFDVAGLVMRQPTTRRKALYVEVLNEIYSVPLLRRGGARYMIFSFRKPT